MTENVLSPLISSGSSFLLVESGSLAGQRFPLPPPPGALLLGRERMCSVRFDPERDRVVGRTHARVETRADGIYLVDLNSANGTFRANGTAVRGDMLLRTGERFQLGGEGGPWLSVTIAAASEAVHVAPPAPEMPTLITPMGPFNANTSRPWPVPSAVHEAPRPVPTVNAPRATSAAPEPPARPPLPAEAERFVRPDRKPIRAIEVAAAAPIALQHQKLFRRQIAVVTLLMILACSIGLALGLREGPRDSDNDIARTE